MQVVEPFDQSPQEPSTHEPLQQSAAAVQAPPVSLQVGEAPGGRQAWILFSP